MTSVLPAIAGPRLSPFVTAGVLDAGDVHVGLTVARRAGAGDDVALATALAVRATRLAHVHVDLATVQDRLAVETDALALDALAWPPLDEWLAALRAAPVAVRLVGDDGDTPLVLDGTRIALDRYWRYERLVAEALRARAHATPPALDHDAAQAEAARLTDLLGPETDAPGGLQRAAVAVALQRRLAVIAGGPGTGKTHTVARLLALLAERAHRAGRPLEVALAAPTGKAAARLNEAVLAAIADVGDALDPTVREQLTQVQARTLHRLLGARVAGQRFARSAEDPLPYDVVVVDETSMVSLPLMARLLDALPTTATLVLVGDPDQLASIEAGAVLGDVVGPAADAARPEDAPPGPLHGSVVVLRESRRFPADSPIGRLAAAIRAGDADAAVQTLSEDATELTWTPIADPAADPGLLRDALTETARAIVERARAGDAVGALDALGTRRLLCPHRLGPHGVRTWNRLTEEWLAPDAPDLVRYARFYLGRPVLATVNDYRTGIMNGDTGVVVSAPDGRVAVAFAGPDGPRLLPPARLEGLETMHAMTIHKSQGSEFDEVVVLLPERSRLLTRELLYTGITRARARVHVVGTEAALREAIGRRAERATDLRRLLWAADTGR